MFNNILLADDLSKRAEKAIAAAIELAKCHQAKLTILNVREDFINKTEMVMLRVDVSKLHNDIKEKALDIKNKIDLDVGRLGGDTIDREVIIREGKPSEMICKVATEIEADLIVMGTHGNNPLKDVIFGSTAHNVINRAKRSVMVVYTKE
ncbi:universal stress protein [bacterium]|nr:universal stress protein [bacterium]MBU1650853.1 universal stress protein [bacterium]MBU1882148.1 universal stress protein [bacterium]